MKPSKAINEQL